MTKKQELLKKALELNLEISEKNTIAEIESAIAQKEHREIKKAEVAKSGKRSAKAMDEAKEKEEKEKKKSENKEVTVTDKKNPKPITRPLLERRGKKYQKVYKLIEKNKLYSLNDAIELALKTSPVKFDASIEVHIKLGVDPRQADQNIRATVKLPNGTGKNVKVAVFAPNSDHANAKKAGADIIGDEDFLKQLDKNLLDFDVLITNPKYMPKLGKYARLLGPRGLMPNPKSGTISADIASAVLDAKAGKVEYRVDKQAIVHLAIGKVSFGKDNIIENANSFFESLNNQKPSSLKGNYIKSISISTTMGPGIKVEIVGL